MLLSEDVIKRRLLIDADGTGDDRRLNVLMKYFIKWSSSGGDPSETIDSNHDRMLAQLAQCEFAMKKSNFSANVMKEELKNYEKISETITSGIALLHKQIEQNKENLVIAKKIRKNRMEYDALAKIINQQPDRQESISKLNSLKGELAELEAKSGNLEKKLEKRQKEFTVLMWSIRELQGDSSDSDSDGEVEEMDTEGTDEELAAADDESVTI